jgi:hypothetical protein
LADARKPHPPAKLGHEVKTAPDLVSDVLDANYTVPVFERATFEDRDRSGMHRRSGRFQVQEHRIER